MAGGSAAKIGLSSMQDDGMISESEIEGTQARPMPDYDILCVGEINIDLIMSGVKRLPDFGQEVLVEGVDMHLGGCTANVASFAASLGMRAALRARLGRDDFGEFLLEELEDRGVSTEFIIRDNRLRTGITVALSGRGDRAFATYLGTIDSLSEEDVSEDMLRRSRHLHVGSYFLQRRLQPGVKHIFSRARQLGLTTSLDTGYDPYEEWSCGIRETLSMVDIFLPNEVEASAIAGIEDPEQAGRDLAGLAGRVVLKLGDRGSRLYDGDRCWSAEAFAVDVVDTTCCGDAFNAGVFRGMLDNRSEAEMLRWGNAAGAIVAGSAGSGCEELTKSAVAELASRDR